ncbi:MAG: carboxymuconolactone decarboxylase family protein [Methanocalculaceae archaeon]|jgi:AhpD family alkylhydroperoxidase|nr:carboxymuconolactone decarboxylase family protein [Methanocalculaceae archaeon]
MVEFDLEFQAAIREIEMKGVKEIAVEWLARVEDEYGAAPLIYKKLAASPEALISHLLYKNAVMQISSLEPRVIELISLAVGAALRCDHCTAYHMQVAKKIGISKEEILETVLVAGLLANSSVLANAYRVIPEASTEPCGVSCAIGGVPPKKEE